MKHPRGYNQKFDKHLLFENPKVIEDKKFEKTVSIAAKKKLEIVSKITHYPRIYYPRKYR